MADSIDPKIEAAIKAAIEASDERMISRLKALPNAVVVQQPDAEAERLSSSEAARKYASEAIAMAFLINGGAIVALLALMGAEGKPSGLDPAGPLLCFGLGAILATVSAVLAYFAQSNYAEGPSKRTRGNCWRRAALIALIFSGGAAAVGTFLAYLDLKDLTAKCEPSSASTVSSTSGTERRPTLSTSCVAPVTARPLRVPD